MLYSKDFTIVKKIKLSKSSNDFIKCGMTVLPN